MKINATFFREKNNESKSLKDIQYSIKLNSEMTLNFHKGQSSFDLSRKIN